MNSDAIISVAFAVLSYIFRRAYRTPDGDAFSRALYRYLELVNWPAVRPELPLLVGSGIFAGVALLFLFFALYSN